MYTILHEQPIDTALACRLCGIQSLDATLNNLLEEDSKIVLFSIRKHLEIEISQKEHYSKYVCQSCCNSVEEWSNFYTRCHNFQTYLKGNTPQVDSAIATQNNDSDSVNENLSSHFSKLVEELVEDGCLTSEQPVKAVDIGSHPQNLSDNLQERGDLNPALNAEVDDEQCITEDEYEDDITTDDEEDEDSDQLSENSPSSKAKHKSRHKKFVFSIPFLERKVGRHFSDVEKTKLLKYINKRQNTLICKLFSL